MLAQCTFGQTRLVIRWEITDYPLSFDSVVLLTGRQKHQERQRRPLGSLLELPIYNLPLRNWFFALFLFLHEIFDSGIPGDRVRFVYWILSSGGFHLNLWPCQYKFPCKIILQDDFSALSLDNIPIEGSYMKPSTPRPVVRTIIVALPYKA